MPGRHTPAGRAVVRLTANFERNLAAIDSYLLAAEAPLSYDALLEELLETVIPNLERYPGMGRRFMDRPGRSVESAGALEKLRARLGEGELREYVMKEYLVIYLGEGEAVYLLSIKHHRQLSFDFDQLWARP